MTEICYYCKKDLPNDKACMKLEIVNITADVVNKLKNRRNFEYYCGPTCVADEMLDNGFGSNEAIMYQFCIRISNSIEKTLANKVIPNDLKPEK